MVKTGLRLLLGLVLLGAAAEITMNAQEPDPFLWLEEIDGERALSWVREHSRKTTSELEAVPEFSSIRSRSLEILNSNERIPAPQTLGNYIYNFWQDAGNPRGLWRRTRLEEYRKDQPEWETVLDVDALARSQNENWVFKGAYCRYPDYRRCLIRLSRGGGDAVVIREFDTDSKSFVEGGFELPEAKSEASWKDRDSLWVGTDFGAGSLTTSGYPRIAKEWKRETPLARASAVFEGKPDDVGASVGSIHRPEGRFDFVFRFPTFYTREYHLIRDGRIVRLDLPDDSQFQTILEGQLVISLRSEWQLADRTYAAGSLLAIDLEDFLNGKRDFQVLFTPQERVVLDAVNSTRSALVVTTLDNVTSRLFQLSFSNKGWVRRELDLPRLGTITVADAAADSDAYFFSFQDFLTPSSLFRVENGVPEKLRNAPAFFDGGRFEVSQNFAVSRDGTRIPYFLALPRGSAHDGSLPTLLYGYGGFEHAQVPRYSGVTGTAWLERGGAYVVANIRGGGEFGPEWHQSALKKNRHKAYEDFIAVAEDLIGRKITSPPHLGIMGGSNGGLLVGVVFTRRPELFNAVVCEVPLLDMKRYTKLLAGASWAAEFGDPEDPDMWEYIRSYSPYHNLSREKTYPPVFFITSTRDDRVHPGHARKMVALMEQLGHPVYYYENTEGGHAVAADNKQQAYMSALEFSYLWKRLR